MDKLFSKEVYRYLGYQESFYMSDENLNRLIEHNLLWLKENAQVKNVHQLYSIQYKEGKVIFDNGMILKSKDLTNWLEPSEKAIVGALTLGMVVDRNLYRLSFLDAYKHLVMDACCTAYVERLCDEMCKEMAQVYDGYITTQRFSPGYGDLKLESQKEVLKVLNTMKYIGLSLNASYTMIPQKSVSFIVGFSQEMPMLNRENQNLKNDDVDDKNQTRTCKIGGACHYCSHSCQHRKANV